MSGQHPHGRLSLLWEEHMRAPFPGGFRGVDFDGVDLVLLDADVAGLTRLELDGGLGHEVVANLWACIAGLDRVLPLIDDDYCTVCFTRLRRMAALAAARHTPGAN
ncbi:hypothetical protein ACF1BE_07235 [Streptomyces sp. NPDC014991]|uniref:hypothetical protein n=1 Tax=Streptomyces sp. NPDC014991 TaxID=3364935 RepID=UPI0036F5FDF4